MTPRIDPATSPGSYEARQFGCNCPVLDNGHGRGYMGGVAKDENGQTLFVIREDCPLHGTEARLALAGGAGEGGTA